MVCQLRRLSLECWCSRVMTKGNNCKYAAADTSTSSRTCSQVAHCPFEPSSSSAPHFETCWYCWPCFAEGEQRFSRTHCHMESQGRREWQSRGINPDIPTAIFMPADRVSPPCALEFNEFFLNKALQDVLYYGTVWSSAFLDILQAYAVPNDYSKTSFQYPLPCVIRVR